MARPLQQFHGGRLFDFLAVQHDQNPVRPLRHHAQVVRDEQETHGQFPTQLVQQLQDARLHADIQRRGRLVGDQQPGLAGDGHGDHDALALTAGQVVRVVLDAALRLRDLHQRQHLHRPPMRGFARQALVQAQRLDDLRAHGMHRIERGHRFLEDHRDLAAPDRAQLRQRQAHQVLPAKADFPGDPSLWRQQAQQGQRGG